MTYGWMLLVVAIAGGAIFSVVGNQSIQSVSGFTGDDVQVADFGITSGSELQFSVSNSAANNLEITSIRVGDREIPHNVEISVADTATTIFPAISESSETRDYEIEFIYGDGSLSNISATGTITGSLQVDEFDEDLKYFWPLKQPFGDSSESYDILNDNTAQITDLVYIDSDRGSILEFEEDGQAVMSEEGELQGKEYTVSFWIYPTREPDDDGFADVLSKGGGSSGAGGRQPAMWLNDDGDSWSMHMSHTTDEEQSGIWWNTNQEIPVREWTHVVMSSSGDQGTLSGYLDGELDSSEDHDAGLSVNTEPFMIGETEDYSYEAVMRLSDVKIYDRVLTPREIQELYEKESTER